MTTAANDNAEELCGPDPGAEHLAPPPPLCVFCSAPWTDDMLKVFTRTTLELGVYPTDPINVEAIETHIDVTCSSCGRLVYRKEIRDHESRLAY